jgi:hypothetical protein
MDPILRDPEAMERSRPGASDQPHRGRSDAVDPKFLSPKKGMAWVLVPRSKMQGSLS